MSKRFLVPALVFAACLFGLSGQVHAGGINFSSVQDGDWSDPNTWSPTGVPNKAAGQGAQVNHTVFVDSAGDSCADLWVGFANDATLNITAGDLDFGLLRFGVSGSGTVNLSGGLMSGGGVLIGEATPSFLNVTGGTLAAGITNVGMNGNAGLLDIVGGLATITVTGLTTSPDGTVSIEPTANGAGGLSTIVVTGNVTLDPGSAVVLDTASYTPSVGDSWDLITYTGSLSGSFGTLSAPTGFAIEEDQTVAGVITIRVIEPPLVPTLTAPWIAALVALLLASGALAIHSTRKARTTAAR